MSLKFKSNRQAQVCLYLELHLELGHRGSIHKKINDNIDVVMFPIVICFNLSFIGTYITAVKANGVRTIKVIIAPEHVSKTKIFLSDQKLLKKGYVNS